MLDVVLIFPMSLQSLVPPGNPAVGGLLIFVIIKMIFLERFKGHKWSYSVFLKLPTIHYNPKYKQEWQALNYTLGKLHRGGFVALWFSESWVVLAKQWITSGMITFSRLL